ncbi:MAG: ribosome small subunit-dependent GTPase A, partial [Lachnospiraceae bacterium]|nr:ribosome small subunit-dependent GTPase A [Lachnospiraceae bacterium]
QIPVKICFNKMDLAREEAVEQLSEIYRSCGCQTVFASVQEKAGLETVKELLLGKTTVVAGPSGVGKSSLTNYLQPHALMEVGEISQKIGRGKNTTRHTELIWVQQDTYFLDTPGFSSMYLPEMEKEELKNYFPEFTPYEEKCRFQGCLHLSEPDCAVKQALAEKKIHSSRYDNYVMLEEELKNKRRY